MSDMTYKYINPEAQEPTRVPPVHYEKILDQVTEKYMGEITSSQFLTIMFNQLNALKKEDEKYFHQALLCIDMGINPKDLRIEDQIALTYTYEYLSDKQKVEKKDFHFLSEDIVNAYDESKNNPRLQADAIRYSNMLDEKDSVKHKDYRDER